MTTKFFEVVQTVRIDYDESKFTPEFMKEFRGYLYSFHSVNDHLEHLAQLKARELIENSSDVEGYGVLSEFGVSLSALDLDIQEVER